MQFISNGPDIPDALLQAHEEDRAVFFCGAGISYPAGLPDFKGLVDEIYHRLRTTPTEIENEAYQSKQFDRTLDLLERRIPGQRMAVRKVLAEALQPKQQRQGAMDTHVALLQLARGHDERLRLVTTNFDRIFEHAAKQSNLLHHTFSAPALPIPKASRWDGLVHLHGQLPSKLDDENALHRLVVTSGDFGLAYLTERWAARFVSELFRNFVVCFVGYSINDPVLRYMMDALAADRLLGEATPQAYALGGCEPGQETNQSIAWKSKGVLPILYEVRQGQRPHSALHQTLKEWAEIHRDGIFGREQIVVQHALARPSESTQQDDFVGRVLWALSDRSGLPAKRFAEINPVPPLEWLMAFSDKRAAWMPLAGNKHDTEWDAVTLHIARWLMRHLNDPVLIHWLLGNGCRLHDRLSSLIEAELGRQEELNRESKADELDKIRANSPHAIVDSRMRLVWNLFLGGRVRPSQNNHNFRLYRWMDHLRRDGPTVSLRMKLREFLSPMIALRQPILWSDQAPEPNSSRSLRQIFDWKLVLPSNHVRSAIGDAKDNEDWQRALPMLLEDLQLLLGDALDLLRELGEADDREDRSFWGLPSIEPHWQNRGPHDWVILIELLRDAWLAVLEDDSAKANRIAEGWFDIPYPTFKRLAFFAASQQDCIDSTRWSEWLLSDAHSWLWSPETHREVMRLLAQRGNHLSSSQPLIETAILAGPRRDMYRQGFEGDRWEGIVERSIWLRLAKLNESGLDLGDAARNRFNALCSANPSWQLEPHQREEFLLWMSGTGDPDYEENRVIISAPRKRRELVRWLKAPPPQQPLISESISESEDTWRDTCRTRFFHCLFALCDLAEEGVWPEARWEEALQVWSEEGQVQRSRRYAAPLINTMPDAVLLNVARSVAWWLAETSKSVGKHEEILLGLCERILNLPLDPGSDMIQDGETSRDAVFEAINHPVGLAAQALLSLWFKREPSDNDNLPDDLEPLFTSMCDTRIDRFRHGRVVLASRLIALFRVDRAWTAQHLLPLLKWQKNPVEAQIVWEGFLWSPRLYWPLLNAIKSQFIETADHYNTLGERWRSQYAAALTYAALESADKGEMIEFRPAFNHLPQEGLQKAAYTLLQALDSAGAQRDAYWANRIRPLWHEVWPKSLDKASADIAEPLALTAIAAGGNFPDAVDSIHAWLRPLEHPSGVVLRLQESNSDLCSNFPTPALRLLDAVIDNRSWPPRELKQCLTSILQASPDIQTDRRYQRLRGYTA